MEVSKLLIIEKFTIGGPIGGPTLLGDSNRTGEVQAHKSEWLTPQKGGVSENISFGFLLRYYYAILFFTTLFTTLREAPANDLYVFWHYSRGYSAQPRTRVRASVHLPVRKCTVNSGTDW